MDKEFKGYYRSPIGIIEILAKDKGIFSINFVDNLSESVTNDLILNCITQLDDYFKGLRKDFDIDMFYNKGTPFQIKVWNALKTIPYGCTCSYKEIACKIGNEKAVRAVGGANNKNNLAIIIPCHRVIGSNGNLIGYNGGLWKKEWLLNHEGKSKNLL
ncbi:methylated-DNA--[protein]-cysteine S-methyltransferase [Clostridium algidicarnis]|uniref:methylated-DNA--[protein]-cysteine S-methyltransferase n=1 Tax=Clostridium algidicarnis TaxID=37659 RepID=UPI001C0D473C|nr:methylated-DNA--[protein]-cysteine S-methyltransferase [Clostridium algidicarnis]MBU3205333.1 methylated-DNA--[protein]-cysteine S-methyltransferase [Clostridium algidicarnis]MBU3213496.1 methylated-DNA--[protein]-cysteine S-methyltransferase [Clostridium algidicarnis]MBU3223601.1 methylated-DNA--[protein]-cysteine S-methyltransferase [Clostridium algidicarnis]